MAQKPIGDSNTNPDQGDGGEGEEEGGEISPMCESIGHRPLRGRCPKKEHYKSYLHKLSECSNRLSFV